MSLDGQRRSAYQVLGFNTVPLDKLLQIWEQSQMEEQDKQTVLKLPPCVLRQVEISSKYASHIQVQEKERTLFKKHQLTPLPDNVDYHTLPITTEEREKLSQHRPSTLFAASRISGIRSSTLFLLYQLSTKKVFSKSENVNSL